jgi:hypothetical protein
LPKKLKKFKFGEDHTQMPPVSYPFEGFLVLSWVVFYFACLLLGSGEVYDGTFHLFVERHLFFAGIIYRGGWYRFILKVVILIGSCELRRQSYFLIENFLPFC